MFQYILLLIAAGSAVGTYWLPEMIVGVGVAALIAFAVERYISHKEHDWQTYLEDRVEQAVQEGLKETNELLEETKDRSDRAYTYAERAMFKTGLTTRDTE